KIEKNIKKEKYESIITEKTESIITEKTKSLNKFGPWAIRKVLLKALQYTLGKCYENGKNERKAFEYYKKSADKGHLKAQFKLAHCYDEGIGTEIDKIKAFECYKKSADQGHLNAKYKLAHCYDEGIGIKI